MGMNINGMSGVNAKAGYAKTNQVLDAVSKDLQKQIAKAQNQLQELSANEEMEPEEKMKKRQEIQKQINDLNNQLRQHQIELRREAVGDSKKQKEKDTSMEDMLGGSKKHKAKRQGDGLSQASMKAMISADAAVTQADVQGSVAVRMEGRAEVLKAEIKQDAALGGNTEAKEQELARAEQAGANATATQMSALGEANHEIKEAADTSEREENKKDTKAEKTDSVFEKREADLRDGTINQQESAVLYIPVDIRL